MSRDQLAALRAEARQYARKRARRVLDAVREGRDVPLQDVNRALRVLGDLSAPRQT